MMAELTRYRDWSPTGFDCKGLNLPDRQDWLVGPSQTRDSACLEQSNFACALELLGGESDNVEVHSIGHWACGWLEIILVHPRLEKELQSIADRLEGYPVLDEEDFSRREWEGYQEQWDNYAQHDFEWGLRSTMNCEDHLDLIDSGAFQQYFESLITSGKYYDSDGVNVEYALKNVTRENLAVFLWANRPNKSKGNK